MSAWTNVPKPTESSIVTSLGFAEPIGMLIAITSITSAPVTSVTTGWTDIAKSTSSTWTAVPKATSSVWTLVGKPTS